MNSFATYYNERFRSDLETFISSIPEESKHHHNRQDKETFTIQYERLSKDFIHLNFLTDHECKINFGISLFFTELVDEVCYSDFKEHYERFRQLTLYPNFIRNCLSVCHYYFHPKETFSALNYSRKEPFDISSLDQINSFQAFPEAIPVMEREAKEFFAKYLPEISGELFWQKCVEEFPFRLMNESSN